MTATSRHLMAALLAPLAVTALVVAPTTVGDSAPRQVSADELPWPDRRFAACGALDADHGTLYAYGGRADDSTTHLGDLWALDVGNARRSRPAWTQVAPQGTAPAPPPVRSCAAAWDAAGQRLLVYGGWNGLLHDGGLRAFDPASGQWQQLCDAISCGPGPGARRASQLVVDAVRNRVLVFGGTNRTYFDDLWSFSFDTLAWSRIVASGPPARGGHSMVVDADRDALYLFGGTRPSADLADLWRLDLTTDLWTELTPQCADGCPSARSGASLALDEAGDRLVLYGGWESTSNTYRREAWLLDGLDETPTWHRIDPDGESPQARFFHVAGFDPAAKQLVVFGGGAFGNAYKDAFGLTLPTDATAPAWHTLSPTTPLTARDQVTVVLDDGILTAFGGFGSGTFPDTIDAGTHLADTWQRQLGRRATWRLSTPVEETHVPIAREGTAFAIDAAGDRLLLFGGLTGDTTLADVWLADLQRPGRPHWQQLCSPTSCGTGPSARWGGHAVYDPVGDRLVVFGGLTAAGSTANDVWALELSGEPAWQQLTPTGPLPSARWSAAYGYDRLGHRLVVFGGQTGPDASGTALADTWALNLDGPPQWTQLATTGPQPAARRSPAGAVRTIDDGSQLVVATGLTIASGTHHDDVWSLDLGDGAAQWVQLDADGSSVGPKPRRSASVVHDPVADRLVMTFGRDSQQFFADTWAFDFATSTWQQLPT